MSLAVVGAVEHLVGVPADDRRLLVRVAAGVAQFERLAVLGADPTARNRASRVGVREISRVSTSA
jgi:hypothetical protein